MKTVIQLLLVTLIFGGVSAGATLFWQKQQTELQTAIQRAKTAESKAAESPLAGLQKPIQQPDTRDEPIEEPPEPPVAVRPAYVEGADETSQLVVSLNQRLRAAHDKERRLNERQESLKLIFSDIRTEQTEINQLRQEVADELAKSSRSVQEAMKAAQEQRDLLRQELDALRPPQRDTGSATSTEESTLPSPSIKIDPLRSPQQKADAATPTGESKSPNPSTKIDSDPATLKRLGAIYDSMPAEVVAEVLQQLAKQGRDAAVVEILHNMKDRQAAKVLATIAAADPAKAASLTELLKRP